MFSVSFLFVCPLVKIPIPFPVIWVICLLIQEHYKSYGLIKLLWHHDSARSGILILGYVGSNGNRISNTECSTCEKCSPNYLKASSETIYLCQGARCDWESRVRWFVQYLNVREQKNVSKNYNLLKNKLFYSINPFLGLCLLSVLLCLLLHSFLNSEVYRSTVLQ